MWMKCTCFSLKFVSMDRGTYNLLFFCLYRTSLSLPSQLWQRKLMPFWKPSHSEPFCSVATWSYASRPLLTHTHTSHYTDWTKLEKFKNTFLNHGLIRLKCREGYIKFSSLCMQYDGQRFVCASVIAGSKVITVTQASGTDKNGPSVSMANFNISVFFLASGVANKYPVIPLS